MKAITFAEHGEVEVLQLTEVATPSPAAGEVLIKVAACGLNHLDIWARRGVPGVFPMPHIGGCEVIGEVVECGDGVRDWGSGTKVMVSPGIGASDSLSPDYKVLGFNTQGGFAEYCVAPASSLIKISDRWKPEEWAATPLVFLTAWHMLVTRARLQKSETVLVHGAGSGIGSAAIQLCKYLGCTVITTAGNEEKLTRAKNELGADYGINYTKHPNFHKEVKRLLDGKGVDVVFEHVGKATWTSSLASMNRGGRLVFCGATTGPHIEMDLRYVFTKQLEIIGSYMGRHDELIQCVAMLEKGVFKPVLDTVYTLAEIAAAQTRMEARNFFGKLAVKI